MKWGAVVMKREFIITAKEGPKVPRITFVRCKGRSESVSGFLLML